MHANHRVAAFDAAAAHSIGLLAGCGTWRGMSLQQRFAYIPCSPRCGAQGWLEVV